MAFRNVLPLLATLMIACLIGCGADDGGVTLANASGVVSYNGAPLAKASIMAFPEKGPIASGSSDDQGKFTLWTDERKGVAIGRIRLAIKVVSENEGSIELPSSGSVTNTNDPSASTQSAMQSMMKFNEIQKKKGRKPEAGKSPLDKYGDAPTSGLIYEIRSGTNDLKVELK
ncbi:MAG: hypothetical protein NT013_04815 [Planctomycetia bacterium]|nr:hypothetical protein [Planctomycetia bacterium]